MYHSLFIATLFVLLFGKASAQDTIVLNGQPQWEKGMPIFNNCFFYNDVNDKALSFEEVQNQEFVLYTDSLRGSKSTMRPLIVEWLRFSIRNTSLADTIHLWVNPGGHYFIQLYNQKGLLAKAGIYEGNLSGPDRAAFAISIPPDNRQTYWLRTEDRQSKFMPSWITLETPYTFLRNNFEGHWDKPFTLFTACHLNRVPVLYHRVCCIPVFFTPE